MIQSPGYPVMNHFQRDCEWKITVPKGRRITFILKDVNFDESIQFHEQVLAFFNGEDVLSPIYQYEFSTKNVTVIKSTDNVATVFFWSHHYSNHRGFVLWFNSNEPTGKRRLSIHLESHKVTYYTKSSLTQLLDFNVHR